ELKGNIRVFCRVRPLLPDDGARTEMPVVSYPVSMESQDHYFAEVSSIPIVDDNDSLLDIYCRSDITVLAKDRAYAQISLDEMSIH
ncbi:Sucrose nonfermenting 4-like protein, partial [Camellia lanceoleosa]